MGANMIIDLASLWNFFISLLFPTVVSPGVIVANLQSSDLSLCSALPLIPRFFFPMIIPLHLISLQLQLDVNIVPNSRHP